MSFLLFVLLGISLIFLAVSLLKVPPVKSGISIRKTSYVLLPKTNIFYSNIIRPLICLAERFIRLPPEKESAVNADLKRAESVFTAKEYYARAVVYALLSALIIPLMYILGLGYLTAATAVFPVLIYSHFITSVKDDLKKKKQKIEQGLPSFIRSVLYKLSGYDRTNGIVQADLISIFEDYLRIADGVFHYDTAMLVMQMKTGDSEKALRNFGDRVALPEMSNLVNALIGIHRGEDQSIALSLLAKDMDIKAKENIRRELAGRPAKVRAACIPLVILALASLLYVLISHLMNAVGVLF